MSTKGEANQMLTARVIELVAEVERLKAHKITLMRKVAKSRAEVERLRAALERIKGESGNPGFAPSAIAREALRAVRG